MQSRNKDLLKPDFCVIGGGAGGLSFAAGAVQMGASVVLIESAKMGGECLHAGCVPSKALLASAKAGHHVKEAEKFGWSSGKIDLDFHKVLEHIQGVISTLEPHDSPQRFQGLGVKVILESGGFTDTETFETPSHQIKAKRFVIATGSSAAIPDIPGLLDVPYLTNETIFSINELPKHLAIIGGGAIGIEMAQAFRRFGSQVTVLEAFKILPKDDSELTDLLKTHLSNEGIQIIEGIKIDRIDNIVKGVMITYVDADGKSHQIQGSHLLIAAGRKANIETLNLTNGGVNYSSKGIVVNQQLRSSNSRVYAIGDCIGSYQFTHMASYHAGLVIRNAIFKLRTKLQTHAVPWVTYTDPELSHVGYQESELRDKSIAYKVLKAEFKDNDRAQTEALGCGLIKVFASPKGYILGVSILGPNAGELIYPWVIAIQNKLKLSAITSSICPYPTLSEISKRVAGSFYTDKLFGQNMKRFVRFLMGITR